MKQHGAQFSVGELVHHGLFGYRGVIVDIDPTFDLSPEWYEQVALSRPPKDAPWYHVLVHDGVHMTYVAEQNLQGDDTGEPIRHPLLDRFFSEFRDGRYINHRALN